MSYVSVGTRPLRAARATDHYLLLLSGVLLGYGVLGKGFAYLGVPPLYIGEITFLIGICVIVQAGHLSAIIASFPNLLLVTSMACVVLRTIPFLDSYGADALRDSVVVMYGGFALIMTGLLLDDPRRIDTLLQLYRRFTGIFVPVIPFILLVEKYRPDLIPIIPATDVGIVQIRPSEAAVHMAGVVVFVVAGFRQVTKVWIGLACAALVLGGVQSRGAMLAEIVPVVLAFVLLGKTRRLLLVTAVALGAFVLAYAVEPLFFDYTDPTSSAGRPVSTRQIVDNFASIVGHSNDEAEMTKVWRLYWWDMIIQDTVYGPHFWTGRGFGLNLADADGFQDGDHKGLPPLRSPHNVQMTMLARAGVPGLGLWMALILAWFTMILRTMWSARRRGDASWAGALLFALCYVLAMLINASFDVALEGPMLGIWFWCLVGFGVGTAMVYRVGPGARV